MPICLFSTKCNEISQALLCSSFCCSLNCPWIQCGGSCICHILVFTGSFCPSLLFDPHPTSNAHVRSELMFKTQGRIGSCHLRVMIRINEQNKIFFIYWSDDGYLFHVTKPVGNICMNHTNFRSHKNLNNLSSAKRCLKLCRSRPVKRVHNSPQRIHIYRKHAFSPALSVYWQYWWDCRIWLFFFIFYGEKRKCEWKVIIQVFHTPMITGPEKREA